MCRLERPGGDNIVEFQAQVSGYEAIGKASRIQADSSIFSDWQQYLLDWQLASI